MQNLPLWPAYFISVQFSPSIVSTLCDPMNRSMSDLPVHHQLPESTQTHVHWVGDAVQPSHPLSSLSPPAFNLSQHQGLYESALRISWPKYWSSSFSISPSSEHPGTDLLEDGLVGSPCCPRDSQESSPTPQFKSINFSALSFLYSLTLTSIHDPWKNHSLWAGPLLAK